MANLLHESDMLVAPPYWTVVTESIDGYSLIPPSGSFDTATEVFVPREIFTKFWDNGEFQSGVAGKKIKFHYKERHFDASLARNEWEVLKPEIVK